MSEQTDYVLIEHIAQMNRELRRVADALERIATELKGREP